MYSGKLVVNIPNLCGHRLSVKNVYTWVQAGFCVLDCLYRSVPGSSFSREALDCDAAVTDHLRSMSQSPTQVILTGSRFGATIASQMSLINSGRYPHLVLTNPEVLLNVVTHPNTISRSFLATSSPLTDVDISHVWQVSPFSSTNLFRSNILLVTPGPTDKIPITQVTSRKNYKYLSDSFIFLD